MKFYNKTVELVLSFIIILAIISIAVYAMLPFRGLLAEISEFTASQNTFSNREFRINFKWNTDGHTDDPLWTIRSGNSRRSGLESRVNRPSDLMSFQSAVESVNTKEFRLIATVGILLAIVAITALFMGRVVAVITAASGSIAVFNAIISLNHAIHNADFYFSRVWFN